MQFYYSIFLYIFLYNALTTALNFHKEREDKRAKVANFNFPEYAYKETSKNELIYHEFEHTCEQYVACAQLHDVLKKSCVRRCISASCYQDIYAFDEV